MISISTPSILGDILGECRGLGLGLGVGGRLGLLLGGGALAVLPILGGDALPAQHGPRSEFVLDEPQPPAAAGADVARELFEVAGRGLEGRLEGLVDLAVGVADQTAQLAQRCLQVLAARLQLLDVSEGLGVLLLRERVDRTELLAAALQALHARAQRLLLLGREWGVLLGLLWSGELQTLADAAQLDQRLGRLVAQALRGDLGPRDRLALGAQAGL